MMKTRPVRLDLTEEEVGVVRMALRAEVMHQDRKRAGLIKKFGKEADLTNVDTKATLLRAVLRRVR